MYSVDDPRSVLMQRWDSMKIGKKNKEYFGVNNAYVLYGRDINKNLVNYYDEVLKETNDKSYAIIKSILSTKNIRLISFKCNNIVLYLKKDYYDIISSPKININMTSMKFKEDIINLIHKNYTTSRANFVSDCVEKDVNNYEFVFKNNDTSYYGKENELAYFVLSDSKNIDDSLFSYGAIKDIINSFDEVSFIDENMYKDISDLSLKIGSKIINIKNVSPYLKNAIDRLVDNHNQKVYQNRNKLVLKKGGVNNE